MRRKVSASCPGRRWWCSRERSLLPARRRAAPRRPAGCRGVGGTSLRALKGLAERSLRPWIGFAAAVAAAATLALSPAGALAAVPDFAEVRAAHAPSDRVFTDRYGEPLQTLRTDTTRRLLAWVSLEAMSPALLDALVLSEDRRFWSHAGVDWPALAAGAWRSAWDQRTRGSSTLTMQLAALLDEDLARPAGGRSLAGKAEQAFTALQLERRWTKSQILEAYLNRVSWRGELVGIGAVSETLFGKHPHGLDRLESAIAAALVRGPNASVQRVADRACTLLAQSSAPTPATTPTSRSTPTSSPDECAELRTLAERALARRGQPVLQAQIAPHAARLALAADSPSVNLQAWPGAVHHAPSQSKAQPPLHSTLDARVQRLARDAVATQLAELAGRSVGDAAVLVVDNASGEVLAWVGSGGRAATAPGVDAVLARRQAGSTLKPFVYLAAFTQGRLSADSRLDDAPTQIPTAAGLWRPQNYDHQHRGWVTARTALGSSLNVPAVRTAQLVGIQALHRQLQDLGLELDQTAGHYGLSLALGSADVSLLALTNAYRTLANGGRFTPLRLHRVDGPPALPPASGATAEPARRTGRGAAGAPGGPWPAGADRAASLLVADILADPVARAAGFGLHSPLVTRGWAAVKTGTSKDMRDNWCIGFTERHTVGVWVGNADGQPMHRVSGVSGAAPIWQAVVAGLAAGAPPSRPPPGLGPAQDLALGSRSPATPITVASVGRPIRWPSDGAAPAGRVGITEPADGSVIALDPDIPQTAQRLWFEGESGVWLLNGRALGRGTRLAWTPVPGRHRLALLGADGRERDAVRFEVRALRGR